MPCTVLAREQLTCPPAALVVAAELSERTTHLVRGGLGCIVLVVQQARDIEVAAVARWHP